jgi:hypothetical protein
MSRPELIRFVTAKRHPPYGHRTGIFQAAYAISREGGLEAVEHQKLLDLLQWFRDNLAEPDRLSVSRHPRADETAISWMKTSAREHVAQLRLVVTLITSTGLVVDQLRTMRPGYVVYEDDHQVVALPFADTRR